jgi:AbiV family abortive infection protein
MKISLSKIQEGIKLALEKCDEHLASAEILASRGALGSAVVSLEFAIEEFGRAIALIEKYKAGSEDVEKKLFIDHDYKYNKAWTDNKAWTVLPTDLKTIYESSFDPAVFDPKIFDVSKETISPRTRLEATHVNYDEKTQKWKVGIRVDRERIQKIIAEINKSKATLTW